MKYLIFIVSGFLLIYLLKNNLSRGEKPIVRTPLDIKISKAHGD